MLSAAILLGALSFKIVFLKNVSIYIKFLLQRKQLRKEFASMEANSFPLKLSHKGANSFLSDLTPK